MEITIQSLKNKKDFYIGKTVEVTGWVKNFRESKTTSFLEINDGSTFKPLQIVIQKEDNGKIKADTLNRVMHLGQVASTLNIPIETLRDLNPQYKLDIVPATKKSYSLRLPTRYASEFILNEKTIHEKDSLYLKEYLNPANLEKKRAEGVGYIYTVRKGDNLGVIAKRNRCTVKELMKWNRLKSTVIRPGQKLRIEKPKPRG